MMIKRFFRKPGKPLSELILQTTRELGKCYSRLELASSKLSKRDKDLFDACGFYSKKGFKARAIIYANEIVEIRKVLLMLQETQLSVERAILRLDTFRVMSPTFESLEAVFGDVKNALGIAAQVMPSITPEINELTSTIGEILQDTQLDISTPSLPTVESPTAEAIIQDAAALVEQDLQSRIPEPPAETEIPELVKSGTPLVALVADASEAALARDDSTITSNGSSDTFGAYSNLLSEELVIDYIERNNGEMNVTRCAEELNAPPTKVFEALTALSRKGKIRIER